MSHQTLEAFKIYQNIHFIGIGGIGISALARILAKEGHQITGSDQSTSKNIELLLAEGIKVSIGQKAENIPSETNLVIYTTAIPASNPEFQAAQKRGLKTLTYPQAVGLLTQKYRSICIAGTHGKTTTTAMVGLMLEASNIDPTVIVGSLIHEFNEKNERLGNSEWLALESCEYQEAFLNYSPEIVVLTCIDPEHLDYFGTEEKYIDAFRQFLKKIPVHGKLIANLDDLNIQKLLKEVAWPFTIITYGQHPGANFQLNGHQITTPKNGQFELELKIPGQHNLMNATAAIATVLTVEQDLQLALPALQNFRGAARRFEIKGKLGNTTIIDDYGHTPAEIQATLQGTKEYFGQDSKILVIFQPHQYSRTFHFLKEFGESFKDADQVYIPNIYRSRDSEADVSKINVDQLVAEINSHQTNRALNTKDFIETIKLVQKNYQNFHAILTIGAGDITKLSDQILSSS